MSITLEERPIFILGCHRSGTTMLMAMLGSHSRIAVPEVAWFYQRYRSYLYTYGDLNQEDNFRTLVGEMIFGLVIFGWGMDINPKTIVDELVSHARERSFAGAYCAILEKYAREVGGKPRWGEKSPNNIFFIEKIREDFPNAQFVYLTRDGRDNCAQTLESPFGPTNMFSAAERWKLFQNPAEPWREKLDASDWLDITYETLVREPEATLRQVCDFLGEDFDPNMLEFYKSPIARNRAIRKAHQPIGQPVTDKYIGIYKEFLSVNDQRIFATVAGREQEAAGYGLDVGSIEISDDEAEKYRELDGRIRAAVLDFPGGSIITDSYIEWLIDQREARKREGIWSDADVPDEFPIGDVNEGLIMGKAAPKKWKTYFSIKRRYF